jgi:succinate dehydrogenase / fumarate reductase membrane anchor subunit
MSMRSALGRVRGLGSAKSGTAHWWSQRLSAIALVPLTLWFIGSLVVLAGASHGEIAAWVSSPIVASLLVLLIATTFYHSFLGLQVVIEDYVHNEPLKLATLIVVQGASFVLALIGIVSVFMLLFGK